MRLAWSKTGAVGVDKCVFCFHSIAVVKDEICPQLQGHLHVCKEDSLQQEEVIASDKCHDSYRFLFVLLIKVTQH